MFFFKSVKTKEISFFENHLPKQTILWWQFYLFTNLMNVSFTATIKITFTRWQVYDIWSLIECYLMCFIKTQPMRDDLKYKVSKITDSIMFYYKLPFETTSSNILLTYFKSKCSLFWAICSSLFVLLPVLSCLVSGTVSNSWWRTWYWCWHAAASLP